MKSLMTYALGTILAGATSGILPAAAQAGRHDVNLDIDIRAGQRHIDPPIVEDRPVRVWVEPVYRTVSEQVWCAPVTQTVTERVWCPDRYEDQRIERRYGRITYERVLVPGHYEDRTHDVVVTPGHYDQVQRQELVTPGHYEMRTDRVVIERSQVDDRAVGRFGLRLPLP